MPPKRSNSENRPKNTKNRGKSRKANVQSTLSRTGTTFQNIPREVVLQQIASRLPLRDAVMFAMASREHSKNVLGNRRVALHEKAMTHAFEKAITPLATQLAQKITKFMAQHRKMPCGVCQPEVEDGVYNVYLLPIAQMASIGPLRIHVASHQGTRNGYFYMTYHEGWTASSRRIDFSIVKRNGIYDIEYGRMFRTNHEDNYLENRLKKAWPMVYAVIKKAVAMYRKRPVYVQ